jgi:ATP adenylyltransferase
MSLGPCRLTTPAGGALQRGSLQALCLRIADAVPVSEGHSLVTSRRHVSDGLALLSAGDVTISGWNVALKLGETAGQTVFHVHWNLIPRRDGDCEEPRVVRGG